MTVRDAIRAATLGSKVHFKSEKVRIGEQEITVRQLSFGEDAKCRLLGTDSVKNDKGESVSVTNERYFPLVIIHSCYDAEGERVFEETDVDGLLAQPNQGGWLADIGAAIGRLSESDSKNLAATTPDAGSSPLPE